MAKSPHGHGVALVRLVGAVLSAHPDERQVVGRCFSAESLAKLGKWAPAGGPPTLLAAG